MGKPKKKSYTPAEAIGKTARHFGVSEARVRREIAGSIRMAYLSGGPGGRAKLGAIPCAGDLPTAEELIAHLMQTRERKATK